MPVTEAERRLICREIDAETERRLARVGYQRPERTAAQTKKLHDDAWNTWVNALIDAKLRGAVKWAEIEEMVAGVGGALAKVRAAMRGETTAAIEAAKADLGEQLSGQIADAVRDFTAGALAPLRVEIEELKARLAQTEARLAAFAADPRAAPLALPGRWVGTA